MSGIGKRFSQLRKTGGKAFIPYIMAGDPSLERTAELVHLLEECGADIVELGVPFSDPLADGPVIQRAAERALAAGVTLKKVIAFIRELRKSTSIPLVVMTYYNPVFKYGEEAFARDAARAGVDGLIIPDLPPDEAGTLIRQCRPHGIDTVFLLAPTSTEQRTRIVAKASRGFIYYVSITGITGAKLLLSENQESSISAIKALGSRPVALGFGVSTPEEARAVSGFADGVIVGSAIVKRINDPGLRQYLTGLRAAIGQDGPGQSPETRETAE
jgi:tryptophan synthase alpha chain